MHIHTSLNDFMNENKEIEIPNIPNTKTYWHGGNLDYFDDVISQKNGRYEYGPGLYLTTKHDIARKYSKGNRKLYLVTVEIGNEIDDSFLPLENIIDFMNSYVPKSKHRMILDRISKYNENGNIPADIFMNTILNEKAIPSKNTLKLRNFMIDNNIDYELVDNAFGFGEEMMVLYNMKKIKNILRVLPTYDIDDYEDLRKFNK